MSDIKFTQGVTQIHNNKEYKSCEEDNPDNTGEEKLIQAIKNKILELFNMKNVNFLFGSGTSAGAIPTMAELYNKVNDSLVEGKKSQKEFSLIVEGIKSKLLKEKKYTSNDIEKYHPEHNLEEILGTLYSNRAYLEIIQEQEELVICKELIQLVEETIFKKINVNILEKEKNLENYKKFYSKIALRNKDLSRINVFTTNNDLFNEYALDSLNINYINGFSGGINKFFNPAFFKYSFSKRMDTSIDKFEPVENMVYLYKIHGSINWIDTDEKENIYFPIKEVYPPKQNNKSVLIYPAPTKQNKSLGSPYVELFREFQTKLLEPNNVLFVIGYSFSDEHVNNIINQALATNSSLTLFILNNVEGKYIDNISDNRIFKVYGNHTINGREETIHYFNYIVNELLPDLDSNKEDKDILKDFINAINKK
ncbi:MAG: SIR2 family protein [Marinifilaceae bacterium]|nr:SIR2 family protein [Marinifilaceae bacterium]